jgi:hypothetical protein
LAHRRGGIAEAQPFLLAAVVAVPARRVYARMKLMSPQTAEPSAMSLNDGFALSLSGELQRHAFHELTTHLPVESVDRKLFDASEP